MKSKSLAKSTFMNYKQISKTYKSTKIKTKKKFNKDNISRRSPIKY